MPRSEGREAEDVRELLSRYFETARLVIERYGGTVETFVGDAVMALWDKGASGLFRELAFPFYLATTQLEHAEWPEGQGRAGELSPVVAEARQIIDQLGAHPLVERAERIAEAAPVPA